MNTDESKRQVLKPAHAAALENFDRLPDSAEVPVQVLASLQGVSVWTIWSRVKSGALPRPIRQGNRCTRWRVEDVRRALSARGAA